MDIVTGAGSNDDGRPSGATRGPGDPVIDRLLPLSPAAFHILLALADGERHGYAIMREVQEQTGGAMRLGPGTLYRSIKRLLADGLIVESDERPDPALDDERRRYYRLSGLGERAVAAEARRLEGLVRLAQTKQLLRGRAASAEWGWR